MKSIKQLIFLSLFFLFLPLIVNAEIEPLDIRFDQVTIQKGYTAEYDNKDFRLAVTPDLINEEITLEMKKFNINEMPLPDDLTLVSQGYIFDIKSIKGTNPLIFNKPLIVAVRFNSDNYYLKSIYTWDSIKNAWIRMPSTTDYQGRYVRAYSHLPFSRIAVFEDQRGLEGTASWYHSYKYPYGATCNNYPENTKLRVTNIDNGKSVVVEVMPGNMTHSTRVIDLSLTAFKQIANSNEGLARVQVVPLEGLKESVKVLGMEVESPQTKQPSVLSKSAIVINEKTGEILFKKNKDDILPLASLTKLMTAYIFLETKTPWDKVVTYQAEDDAIGAKLYVNPGEIMTVKDLFFSSLVGSANNATNALARSTGLSRKEFVKRMNDKAKEWGLSTIHFEDVTGLNPNNKGSAADYAILAKNTLRSMDMLVGTTSRSYSFTTINTNESHSIINKNKLVDSRWYITGMKTGYLDEAGYCLVAKVREGKYDFPDVIAVVLGAASDQQRYDEIDRMIEYGLMGL